jgi:hypothetical protein
MYGCVHIVIFKLQIMKLFFNKLACLHFSSGHGYFCLRERTEVEILLSVISDQPGLILDYSSAHLAQIFECKEMTL